MNYFFQPFFISLIFFLEIPIYIPFLSWCELFTQLLHSVAWARKGSGLGKDVHDATYLSLSFVGYLSSTHFLWLLSCTALTVSLFRTPRDGFKVAVFIWYVCCCLPQHSVSVQSPTALFNSRFKTFFYFEQFPPSEIYIPSFLSWIKLFTQCYQRYEPCNCSGSS